MVQTNVRTTSASLCPHANRWVGRDLRAVALLEGASYLLLLGVAMPLKYLAGMPGAVRAVGSAHGGLFLLYVAAVA